MLRLESHLSFLGLVNPDSSVDVEIIRDGATRVYRIPLTQAATDIPQSQVLMDWRIEKSNNLGYFRFDKFPPREAKEDLAVEIGKFFGAVIKEGVSNVAFDWRYNEGGNLPIVSDILSYVKACPEVVPGLGTTVTKKSREQLFDGNLFVMTSNKTFSAAVVSVTVLSDNRLVRTLGEPTGENPDFNRHGTGADGDLPVSAWHFMMVSGKSDRPRPNYSETAVKLDIPVFTSRLDVIAGRDIQLERLREIAAGRNWRYPSASVDIAVKTESIAVERGAALFFDTAKKTIVLDRDLSLIKRSYFIDTATNTEIHEAVLQNGWLRIPGTLKPGAAYHLVFELASSNIAFLSTVLAESDRILDLLPLYVKSFSYVERFHYFIITFNQPIKKLNPGDITVTDQQGRSLETISVAVAVASPETLVIRPAEWVTMANPCIITLPANAFVLESGATNPSALRLGNYKYWK